MGGEKIPIRYSTHAREGSTYKQVPAASKFPYVLQNGPTWWNHELKTHACKAQSRREIPPAFFLAGCLAC